MSGDVKDGNGIVVINFDKCIIDWNSEMEFPEIYSLIPLIQGQLELPTTAAGKMLVVEIAPDKSPFWMSIAHELIHVFHKLTDPEAYEKRIRSTPQEVIKSISKNQTLYPNFFELRVPRLSQALWTNEEERETVVGIGISELTIRREMNQKIRYIYQASDKVFLELKETVDRVNGSPLTLPSIPLSFDSKFDLGLTPLNILGKIFEKQQLVSFLLDENSYIGHNMGTSLTTLRKLGLLRGIPEGTPQIPKKEERKLKLSALLDQ